MGKAHPIELRVRVVVFVEEGHRKRGARSFDAICDAFKNICDLFDLQQCRNFFKVAGYESKRGTLYHGVHLKQVG